MMAEQQKNEEAQLGDSPCGSASQQQETSVAVKVDGDKGGGDAKDENKDTSFKYYLVSLCVSWQL